MVRLSASARPTPRAAPKMAEQHHALGEHLRDQPCARGAERGAHRHLAITGRDSREQQIGEIQTGHQQHQPGDPEEEPQRRLVVRAQAADAAAAWLCRQPEGAPRFHSTVRRSRWARPGFQQRGARGIEMGQAARAGVHPGFRRPIAVSHHECF